MTKRAKYFFTLFVVVGVLAVLFRGITSRLEGTKKRREYTVYSECLDRICREEEQTKILRNPDTECYSLRPRWLDAHTVCTNGIPVTHQAKLK